MKRIERSDFDSAISGKPPSTPSYRAFAPRSSGESRSAPSRPANSANRVVFSSARPVPETATIGAIDCAWGRISVSMLQYSVGSSIVQVSVTIKSGWLARAFSSWKGSVTLPATSTVDGSTFPPAGPKSPVSDAFQPKTATGRMPKSQSGAAALTSAKIRTGRSGSVTVMPLSSVKLHVPDAGLASGDDSSAFARLGSAAAAASAPNAAPSARRRVLVD